MTQKAPDLLPCPFCGGNAVYAKTHRGWKVECEGRFGSCKINARTHYQPSKFNAEDAWNTRADHALALVAAAYEDAAKKCQIAGAGWEENGVRVYPSAGWCADYLRKSAPDDAQAALERVKREARNEALDAASEYLKTVYGNSPLSHPVDRKRILALMEDTDDD